MFAYFLHWIYRLRDKGVRAGRGVDTTGRRSSRARRHRQSILDSSVAVASDNDAVLGIEGEIEV